MGLTILIFLGLLISIVISSIHKCGGAIAGLIVTVFILCVGLDAYRSEGWSMTFFGIEISRNVFLIIIGVSFLFNIIGLFSCRKKR